MTGGVDRHVICIGGGCVPHSNLQHIEKHLIALSKQDQPRVCYIPTADGDNPQDTLKFYEQYAKLNCRVTHLPLFRRSERTDTADIQQFLMSQDIIFVGGGNTLSMIALWKAWGVDKALRHCYEAGKIVCGVSAGSNCWFTDCTTDSYPGELAAVDGLAWLPHSHSPHYNSEKTRRPTYHRLIQAGELHGDGYAADDGAAIHFINEKVHDIITWMPDAHVYHVTLADGKINEKQLESDIQLDKKEQ